MTMPQSIWDFPTTKWPILGIFMFVLILMPARCRCRCLLCCGCWRWCRLCCWCRRWCLLRHLWICMSQIPKEISCEYQSSSLTQRTNVQMSVPPGLVWLFLDSQYCHFKLFYFILYFCLFRCPVSANEKNNVLKELLSLTLPASEVIQTLSK